MAKNKRIKIPKNKSSSIAASIDAKIKDFLGKMYDAIKSRISNNRESPDIAYSKVNESMQYGDFVESNIVSGISESFLLHNATTNITPASAEMFVRKTWLNKTFFDDKITLKTAINDSIRRNETEIKQSLRKSLEDATNAKQTARNIVKNVESTPNQNIMKLAELARRKMKGELSSKEIAAFNSGMRRMARYVDSLETQYDTRLSKAYKSALDVFDSATEKTLDRAIERVIKAKQYYNAQQISRTEIARAYGQAQYNNFLTDNDIVAYRRELSSSHKIYDICDFLANADMWGLGKGVTPKDKTFTYPAHPNDMCTLVPVYEWEIDSKPKLDMKNGSDYIDSLSEQHKKDILGVSGYAAYKKGDSWENHLKNWNGISNVEMLTI